MFLFISILYIHTLKDNRIKVCSQGIIEKLVSERRVILYVPNILYKQENDNSYVNYPPLINT